MRRRNTAAHSQAQTSALEIASAYRKSGLSTPQVDPHCLVSAGAGTGTLSTPAFAKEGSTYEGVGIPPKGKLLLQGDSESIGAPIVIDSKQECVSQES